MNGSNHEQPTNTWNCPEIRLKVKESLPESKKEAAKKYANRKGVASWNLYKKILTGTSMLECHDSEPTNWPILQKVETI